MCVEINHQFHNLIHVTGDTRNDDGSINYDLLDNDDTISIRDKLLGVGDGVEGQTSTISYSDDYFLERALDESKRDAEICR